MTQDWLLGLQTCPTCKQIHQYWCAAAFRQPKESRMKYKPAQVKKAVVAAATFAANLVAAGVIDGKASLIVMAAVSALGVYGVFAVKNADA